MPRDVYRGSMTNGRRIDWRAIPGRYRAWRALPAWRKSLWLLSRGATVAVLYVTLAVGILWYNAPTVVGDVGAGRASAWAVVGLLGARPELLGVLLLLVPAVLAGVILPHRPSWGR